MLGGGTQPCGLKVSERLFWRGAGEEGEPAPPLPGSRLGGRHEISQQIMKLSLIAGESEGRRGVRRGGSLLCRGAPAGHEKHVFGGAPAVNGCSVSPRSWHSLGLKDAQGLERSAGRTHSFVRLLQVNEVQRKVVRQTQVD